MLGDLLKSLHFNLCFNLVLKDPNNKLLHGSLASKNDIIVQKAVQVKLTRICLQKRI